MGIAQMIDHTMLKADASRETIVRYCKEAREHKFASVCVNSAFVPLVAKELEGSGVKTCCVVGFPLGAMLTTAKAFEAAEAVKAGAQEIDMVINISALKDKDYSFVEEDIRAVAEAEAYERLANLVVDGQSVRIYSAPYKIRRKEFLIFIVKDDKRLVCDIVGDVTLKDVLDLICKSV